MVVGIGGEGVEGESLDAAAVAFEGVELCTGGSGPDYYSAVGGGGDQERLAVEGDREKSFDEVAVGGVAGGRCDVVNTCGGVLDGP